jgi:hypothetical protein
VRRCPRGLWYVLPSPLRARLINTRHATADVLLPPLNSLLRESRAPVILRTSAISLLSECVKTCDRVIARYTEEIAEGMVDLVLVEMTVAKPTPRPAAKAEGQKTETGEEVSDGQSEPAPALRVQPERPPDTLDISPLSRSPKVPALRRAALRFLVLFLRVLTREANERNTGQGGSWSGVQIRGIYGGETGLYNGGRVQTFDEGPLTPGFIKRARTVSRYVAAADEDAVVRVMAREVDEGLEGLQEALRWL